MRAFRTESFRRSRRVAAEFDRRPRPAVRRDGSRRSGRFLRSGREGRMKRYVLLGLALASFAYPQSSTLPPFSIRTDQPNLTQLLSDGGTLSFVSDGLGINSDAAVTITYRPTLSTLAATITQVDVSGSVDFSIPGLTDLNNAQ